MLRWGGPTGASEAKKGSKKFCSIRDYAKATLGENLGVDKGKLGEGHSGRCVGIVGGVAVVLPCSPGGRRDLHTGNITLVLGCVLKTEVGVESPRIQERGTNLEQGAPRGAPREPATVCFLTAVHREQKFAWV